MFLREAKRTRLDPNGGGFVTDNEWVLDTEGGHRLGAAGGLLWPVWSAQHGWTLCWLGLLEGQTARAQPVQCTAASCCHNTSHPPLSFRALPLALACRREP